MNCTLGIPCAAARVETTAAITLLGERGQPGELIFKSVNEDAIRAYVEGKPSTTEGKDATVHGFRSTFRDWAAERGYPFELGELALAHVVGGTVARAYLRTNMVKERRPMMQAWADFATAA